MSSWFGKDTTWRFWRVSWILRVHMYLLTWRKTNFFCGISIVYLNLISKLIKSICLHFWLPKLHKSPYKSLFISNSSHCSTTILSKHITSALTAVKKHVLKYSETAGSNSNVDYFLSIKNSSKTCGCETFSDLKYLLSILIPTWSYHRKSVVYCYFPFVECWCF